MRAWTNIPIPESPSAPATRAPEPTITQTAVCAPPPQERPGSTKHAVLAARRLKRLRPVQKAKVKFDQFEAPPRDHQRGTRAGPSQGTTDTDRERSPPHSRRRRATRVPSGPSGVIRSIAPRPPRVTKTAGLHGRNSRSDREGHTSDQQDRTGQHSPRPLTCRVYQPPN